MTSLPEMPSRLEDDGAVKVNRIGDFILIEATGGGKTENILISTYNAWRIFGMLSVLMGIPLHRAVSKVIRL